MIKTSILTSALRRQWFMYDPARKAALLAAKTHNSQYICNICKYTFPKAGVQVDHIDPIGKFIDWNTFMERLYCLESNLQVLCKNCHKNKGKKL